jgi:hypothetical protein
MNGLREHRHQGNEYRCLKPRCCAAHAAYSRKIDVGQLEKVGEIFSRSQPLNETRRRG